MKRVGALSGIAIRLGIAAWLGIASTAAVAATKKPDWKVTELTAERIESAQSPLRIKVVVKPKNAGSVTSSGQFLTRLEYRRKSTDPWTQLFEWHGGATAAGGGARYEKFFDFDEGGTFTFRATVDPEDAIDEVSEGNNAKMFTRTFEAGTPDLVVQNLSAGLIKVLSGGGRKVKVQWDVANIGDGKAKASFITVLEVSKNGGSWAEIQRYSKSNLTPGAAQHYTREMTYADFNSLVFKVTVDDTAKIHESKEGNNFETSDQVKP